MCELLVSGPSLCSPAFPAGLFLYFRVAVALRFQMKAA